MRKLTKLLTLAAILWALPAKASVLSYMYALQPNESHEENARLILKYAKKYDVNPYIVVAIAFQESGLHPNHHRFEHGKATDLSFAQLNIGTIKTMRMNTVQLLLDNDYYWEQAIHLLAQKIETCKSRKGAYGCYNSGTPKYFRIYLALVWRHLRLAPQPFRLTYID